MVNKKRNVAYTKPLTERQKREQKDTRIRDMAYRIWRAAIRDLRGRRPYTQGREEYDRAAKLALAQAVDDFTDLAQEEAFEQ